jgi:hypothetical protein
VDLFSFEGVEPFDIGPFPVTELEGLVSLYLGIRERDIDSLQKTRAVDKEMAPVADSTVVLLVEDLELPDAPRLIPHGTANAVAKFDVVLQPMPLGGCLQISQDLPSTGVAGR